MRNDDKVVSKIVSYNRVANAAIEAKNYNTAKQYLCKLHKLEAKDRVPIGSYRLKAVR